MTLSPLLAYLLNGSDALYMSKSWLMTNLAPHEAWTLRQLDQGSIVHDTAWFKRAAFWQSREKPQLRIVRAGER